MIEDGDEPTDGTPSARCYDAFKHMTGVSLLSLGGVFGFADGGRDFERKQLVVVVGFILIATVTIVLMAGQPTEPEVKCEPR